MLVSKLNIAIDDNYQVVGTISPNKITDKKVKPYWELDWDLLLYWFLVMKAQVFIFN